MQYMLLIAGDETAAEHADDGCEGWSEEMAERGVIRGGGGLRPPNEATTLRVRDDKTRCAAGRATASRTAPAPG